MPDAHPSGMRIVLVAVLASACATTPRPRPVVATTVTTALGTRQIDEPASERTPSPLDGLGTDVAHAFWGYNLIYYAGAAGATSAIALSGVDETVHERVTHSTT